MKRLIAFLLGLTSLYAGAEMKVKVTLDSGVYFSPLADNPTSQSF